MKKLVSVIFVLFTITQFSFAQKGQQSIGILTGLNNSLNLDYQKDFGADPLFEDSFFSPVAGFYYSNNLTKRLGLNFEVRYLAAIAKYNCEQCRFIDVPTA